MNEIQLQVAVRDGNIAVVKYHIRPSIIAEYDQTLLILAVENGRAPVVKFLLTTGNFDVNVQDRFGWTPLSFATENGHKAVVKLLKERRE